MDKKECCRRRFEELMEDMVNLVYNEEGALGNYALSSPSKPIPSDPTGDECTCGSIKNYPRDTRKTSEKSKEAPSEKGAPRSVEFSKNFFLPLV